MSLFGQLLLISVIAIFVACSDYIVVSQMIFKLFLNSQVFIVVFSRSSECFANLCFKDYRNLYIEWTTPEFKIIETVFVEKKFQIMFQFKNLLLEEFIKQFFYNYAQRKLIEEDRKRLRVWYRFSVAFIRIVRRPLRTPTSPIEYWFEVSPILKFSSLGVPFYFFKL